MKENKQLNTIGFKTSDSNVNRLNELVKKTPNTTRSEILHLMLSFFLKSNIVFVDKQIKIK